MTATSADINGHNSDDEKLAAYLSDFVGEPDPRDPAEGRIPHATLHQDRVEIELDRLRAYDEARRLYAAERSATVEVPEGITLDTFLSEPDEDAAYRIDGLLPTGGRALLAAQYKAGKTTLVGNLLRCLVDGTAFLGRFQIERPCRVAIIDDEIDERQLRRQLREHNVVNQAAVKVFPLRGRVSSFNILDADVRAVWAERLSGYDVLVFDCLRPVLDALGLDENREAGRLLVAFDELLRESQISEAVVVHHMGHSGERSRGDSRLLDWPDVLWKIVRENTEDPAADRYFSAYGRDVDVREGKLDYTHANRSLVYLDTSRSESAGRAVIPDIVQILNAADEGLSFRSLQDALVGRGHPRQTARESIRAAVSDRTVYTTPGPRNSTLHHLNPASVPNRASSVPAQ